MKLKSTTLVASVIALLLPTVAVTAQSTSSDATNSAIGSNSNSLRIAPVRTDVSMDPGTTKEIMVYAQNLTPAEVSARAIVSDFSASMDETGRPNVQLDEDDYAPSHSLKRLSVVEPNVIIMKPNERVGVKVRIIVPKNAMAGGYYGAVRFVPVKNVTTGDDTGVAISTNIGSLILLKVNGDLEEKLSLKTFEVRQKDKPGTFFTTPKDLKVRLRVQNEGNIQVQPFGKVRVLDRSGKVVEEYEINNTDPRGNVLPESIRRFEVDLKKISSFGKYTVEGNFGYGAGGQLITTKTSFWVVPITYMVGAAAGLILIIFMIIFVPRMIRSYNRRIVRRAGRRY